MCGIVGSAGQEPGLRDQLGALMVPMLVGMTERGPDSAGLAVYTEPVSGRQHKLSLYSGGHAIDWLELLEAVRGEFGRSATDRDSRQSRGAHHRGRPRPSGPLAQVPCARGRGALRGPVDRFVQGRWRAGGHRAALPVRVAQGHASGRAHAHGHRIGRDSRACAPVYRRARFLPGAQRLALQSASGAQAPGAARHRIRNRQRHRGGLPLLRVAAARRR